MTICSKMYEALDKRLEEKKSLDEIGSELCDAVIDPRGKAIRLIKNHKGEKYLKENAEWLGYEETNNPKGRYVSDEKIQQEAIREDARSNGLRVDTPINYGMNSGVTIQSMQDEFEPDEIVYEKNTEGSELASESCSFSPEPQKEDEPDMKGFCPCGCGYRYDEEKHEWYNENKKVINVVLVNVKMNTYERLLRRMKKPKESMDIVLNRILDGEVHGNKK